MEKQTLFKALRKVYPEHVISEEEVEKSNTLVYTDENDTETFMVPFHHVQSAKPFEDTITFSISNSPEDQTFSSTVLGTLYLVYIEGNNPPVDSIDKFKLTPTEDPEVFSLGDSGFDFIIDNEDEGFISINLLPGIDGDPDNFSISSLIEDIQKEKKGLDDIIELLTFLETKPLRDYSLEGGDGDYVLNLYFNKKDLQ